MVGKRARERFAAFELVPRRYIAFYKASNSVCGKNTRKRLEIIPLSENQQKQKKTAARSLRKTKEKQSPRRETRNVQRRVENPTERRRKLSNISSPFRGTRYASPRR
jgi:hypothetical protein